MMMREGRKSPSFCDCYYAESDEKNDPHTHHKSVQYVQKLETLKNCYRKEDPTPTPRLIPVNTHNKILHTVKIVSIFLPHQKNDTKNESEFHPFRNYIKNYFKTKTTTCTCCSDESRHNSIFILLLCQCDTTV